MEAHPVDAYADELLGLAPGLPRAAADELLRRVFRHGVEEGAKTALANVAQRENAKDAENRRLAERLVELGEDPLSVTRIMRGP
ncbi:hypothetical protein LN042_02575 [Kitasatospora sp. RB6PN24]|uniref:hypothetical protein n=1 Tax=Kitasatospora humi TaxID=2893891 RepID=UPI001E44681E|nr:hypothetical protein [Kitasatospora humi]MCC9306002.1 hypothetical protein [Kitasatospora humi]